MKTHQYWLSLILGCLVFGALHFGQIWYFDDEPLGKAIFNTFCVTLFWGAWMAFAMKYIMKWKN